VEETVEEDDDADVDDESHPIGEENHDNEVYQDDENNDDDDDDDDSDNKDDDVEDNEDDDDDDDDPDYAVVSSKKGKKSISQPLLFTNGLGFSANNQSKLSTVVESVASKKEFSLHCKPDVSLFCLVYWWARRTAFNFAADVLNSNLVVAREIGFVSPFDLCNLRGWVLTRRGSTGTQVTSSTQVGLKKSPKIFPPGIFHPLGMLEVHTLFGPLVEVLPLPFPDSAFDP
jgi:hypothetical protein